MVRFRGGRSWRNGNGDGTTAGCAAVNRDSRPDLAWAKSGTAVHATTQFVVLPTRPSTQPQLKERVEPPSIASVPPQRLARESVDQGVRWQGAARASCRAYSGRAVTLPAGARAAE